MTVLHPHRFSPPTLLAALIGSMVCSAGTPSFEPNRSIIQFPEPVVSTTTVERSYTAEQSTPDDRGENLFAISGGSKPLPEAHWSDQDTLHLTFPEGSSCSTEFCLSITPGTTYLSKTPVEPREFRFYRPSDTRLNAQRLGGSQDAFLVSCQDISNPCLEALQFGTDSPVTYRFRAVTTHERRRPIYGEEVPGIVRASTLADGLTPFALRRLISSQQPISQLQPGSTIPAQVVVTPEKPLDASKTWQLWAYAPDRSGFLSAQNITDSSYEAPALYSTIHHGYREGTYELTITYSDTLTKAALREIFHQLVLSSENQIATLSADGNCWELNTPGQNLRFCLVDRPNKTPAISQFAEGISQPIDDNTFLTYKEPDADSILQIKVSGLTRPTVLDITLPAGTTAKRGLVQECATQHRITLHPAAPALQADSVPVQLPLTGKHELRLHTINQQAVRISAAHWEAENAASYYTLLQAGLQDDRTRRLSNYIQHIITARQQLELPKDFTPEERERYADELKRYQQLEDEQRAHRSAALQHATTTFPAITLPTQPEHTPDHLPQETAHPEDTPLSSAEILINLDTLTGGNTRPGLYLITVTGQANAQIRAALQELGLPEDSLDLTRDYLIQISDLQLLTSDRLLLLFSGADGRPIPQATLRSFTGKQGSKPALQREHGKAQALNQGVIRYTGTPELLLLQAGGDYLLYQPRYHSTEHAHDEDLSLCITDRNLYRPGDTVHLHGMLRNRTHDNQLNLPQARTGQLTVRRPNGEILCTQTLTLDAYGACDTSFTLPQGEEDVTGYYRAQLVTEDKHFSTAVDIPCQVFRRDAVTGTLSAQVDPIAPKQLSISVRGQDLNGAALAGARVELTLQVPGDRREARARTQHLPDVCWSNQPQVITRELTLNAQGEAAFTTPLNTLGTNSIGFMLTADATLINDREERFRLVPISHRLTPGKLILGLNGTRLVVQDTQHQPYSTAQPVRVRLYGKRAQIHDLGQGFSQTTWETECLSDTQITVPAHCTDGVDLPLAQYRDCDDLRDVAVLLESTDGAGHRLAACIPLPYYRQHFQTNTSADAHCEGRELVIPANLPQAGTAQLMIYHGRSMRNLVLPVQAGQQEYRIPLQAEECGKSAFSLTLMQQDSSGTYSKPYTLAGHIEIPYTHQQLQLTLDLPQQAATPGSAITLSGTANLTDGQPADAQITFYAVDAGMLSLSGYELPQPLSTFYSLIHRPLYPSSPLKQENTSEKPNATVLPGIWLGDVLSGNPDGFSPQKSLLHTTHPARANRVYATGTRAVAKVACAPVVIDTENAMDASGDVVPPPTPRLRRNFIPVAFWQGSLHTDAQGRFSTTCTLPDTLTTYRVFAIAASRDGRSFGSAEGKLMVNQPIMLTPGTPLFMSTGDSLRLPLTITNNTRREDTWTVTLSSGEDTTPAVPVSPTPQHIRLAPGETGTLYFDVSPQAEGTATLRWDARAEAGSDAVAGSFGVRFPAPVLRENHRLVLQPGQLPTAIASLLAPELADSTRGSIRISLSANPMIHLAGCADFLCTYPYGCTEQTASALLPYLLYKRLAPFTPSLSKLSPEQVDTTISKSINTILSRQQPDGGLSYWGGGSTSTPWVTAYAGLVLTLATEHGHEVPEDRMNALRDYLRRALEQDSQRPEQQRSLRTLHLYAAGRTLCDNSLMDTALRQTRDTSAAIAEQHGRDRALPDLLFISTLRNNPDQRHAALLTWLRSRGHDYRHRSSWIGGWTLLALAEYLRLEPDATAPATVRTDSGHQITLGQGITDLTPPQTKGRALRELATTLAATEGTVYATVSVRALPETTHFPGLTEKGLQVTRLYEKKGHDGIWRPATEFAVGDLVRITLTCAKIADELEYLVLEDYLPASMEAINPEVPSQAAELEPLPWSLAFDHREYLADRVRGFCTRWATRDVVNLSYYARVKRAGTATAPPASAQLMYEPQTYGLSPNQVITTQ